MKLIKVMLTVAPFLLVIRVEASYFRDLDYDEVRREGGFNSPTLFNVTQIRASGVLLTPTEKQQLRKSTTLKNLRTLDLNGQQINDTFIQKLSENETFSRIINLNISQNNNITYNSIRYILNSDFLGSIRDLEQISGYFGCSASTIYVDARGTKIINADIPPNAGRHIHLLTSDDQNFEVYRSGFVIHYRHSVTQQPSAPTAARGVKFVEVKRSNYY